MVGTFCRVCLHDQSIASVELPEAPRERLLQTLPICGFCLTYLAAIPETLFTQLLHLVRHRAWERGDVR